MSVALPPHFPCGLYAVLGSTATILKQIEELTKSCETGIRFLHAPSLTKNHQDDVCMTTDSEQTKTMIKSLLNSNENKEQDGDNKDNKNKEKRKEETATQYIVIDISGLQPVHYRSTIKEVLFPKIKTNSCACFILGAEYLTKDIEIDAWLFPDPEWFLSKEKQELLLQWGTQMKMNGDVFQQIINGMNEQDNTITSWSPKTQKVSSFVCISPDVVNTKETNSGDLKQKGEEVKKEENKETKTPSLAEYDAPLKQKQTTFSSSPSPSSSSSPSPSSPVASSSPCGSSSGDRNDEKQNQNQKEDHEDIEWIDDAIDDREPVLIDPNVKPQDLVQLQTKRRSWCSWCSRN